MVLVAWFGPKRAPTRGAPTGIRNQGSTRYEYMCFRDATLDRNRAGFADMDNPIENIDLPFSDLLKRCVVTETRSVEANCDGL